MFIFFSSSYYFPTPFFRIYKSFGGEKWKSNVLLTSMLCPGVVFAHFFVMNLVLWYYGSSAAIPFFTLVALLALWFGVSVPLTFVGAYFGFRYCEINLQTFVSILRYFHFIIILAIVYELDSNEFVHLYYMNYK